MSLKNKNIISKIRSKVTDYAALKRCVIQNWEEIESLKNEKVLE